MSGPVKAKKAKGNTSPARVESWARVIERAAEIVGEYDTPVTLRQLFYRLVSEQAIPNTRSAYNKLSTHSAEARRDGTFPDLLDETRSIDRALTFTSPDEARKWLRGIYRRDRTEGQAVSLYLGVEKRGLVQQLRAWFRNPLGIPILPLGGYSSQTFADNVARDADAEARPCLVGPPGTRQRRAMMGR